MDSGSSAGLAPTDSPQHLERKAYKRQLAGHIFRSANQEASELYWTAGNLYSTQEHLEDAARCWMAGVALAAEGDADSMQYALDAGDLYMRLEQYEQAAKALNKGIDMALSSGRGRQVPHWIKVLAQAQRHLGDVPGARSTLEQASALYFAENKLIDGAKCLMQIGDLLGTKAVAPKGYWEAVEAYNQVVDVMVSQGLEVTAHVAIKQVFCAVLCEHWDLGELRSLALFESERGFLERMAFAVKSLDEDVFTEMLWEWDQRYRMDRAGLDLSLKVKRVFDEGELL